ncbi:CpaE family protein [Streptomyces sp. NPDC093589]|uniref:AAA family ATPase n=1 Tax=Streptomyces sp. NPDC093589 TaxID=3366043 RepID=UPI003813694F
MAQRAGRAVRRAIASSPAAETAAVTEAAYAIQQPVTSGRQISVTSIRGGAGKSTVAALLALTYAHYRSDPVLAVEADPALGTLPHRLGAREVRWSGTDLAQIVDPSMLITDLTGYLLPFPGGGWLLPGSQGAIGTRLDIDTYRVVMTSLRRYFATTVVDCETLPTEVARTALVTTQARVLVSPATPEGVVATRSILDWVGGVHPGMLPTTVVVLSHVAPDTGLDLRKAVEHLGIGGAVVLPLPYDRHLAAGGAIRTELLGERTLQAAARIAAEVMNRAVSRGPGKQRPGQSGPAAASGGHAPGPGHTPGPGPGPGSASAPGPAPASAQPYGTPPYGAPSEGAPPYGTPSYGASPEGAPSYGTPSYGASSSPPPPGAPSPRG